MFRRLTAALYLRRLVRNTDAIAAALTEQNRLLRRLADHFAPADPVTDRTTVAADTGVDTFDPIDGSLAEAYRERTFAQTGHLPDDEEVAIYLADEKTVDLHQRLVAREAELARLAEARA